MWLIWIAALFGILYLLARHEFSLRTWTGIVGATLAFITLIGGVSFVWGVMLWTLFAGFALVFNRVELRRRFVSAPLFERIRANVPEISQTERQAIEAGTVWWDGELFRGNPDFRKLLDTPAPVLTREEQAFLDGPVEQLCEMLDDWEITHLRNDLPPMVWDFLKLHRFYGINIPREYGGLGFSPTANSEVVMKVSSRSGSAGVTVMVPNSLGPAELLLHYGTPEQKDYYLPRLARGQEIPCFALTGPWAGSDAGAMMDAGIVCEREADGKTELGLRVSWDKRYITLGPVATVLGLAFKAYDPDGLLGDKPDLGITCALIPVTTPGVEIGNRHLPLNAAFQNGPTSGHDVFVPMSWIIGGRDRVGQGWRMLMESLAAGRAISLPASGVCIAKVCARTSGAYARIREQFGIPIAKFEGIEEPLARIGGLTYMLDATRRLTLSALEQGEKPSVISAIAKYQLTEGGRQVVNDAMDVHGGKGICMGPRNYLARAYQQTPIAITVEGANILTRSLIIFGQGAMRCHPWLMKEVEAVGGGRKSLDAFDAALTAHLGYAAANKARAFLYGLSDGLLAPAPEEVGLPGYYRKLARYSAAFAFLADVTLLLLGGDLKRKEKLSGRFADALGHMYMLSAVLKHHQDGGASGAELPLVHWSARYCLAQIQQALDGVLRNFPVPWLGMALRPVVFPLGRRESGPDDATGAAVAGLLTEPSPVRDRLTSGIYLTDDPKDITGCLEDALVKVIAASPVRRKVRAAGIVQRADQEFSNWVDALVEDSRISAEEARLIRDEREAVSRVIAVDDFKPNQVARN